MTHTKYDVIIVGAGFTGLTAAYELAKNGRKVLVLESDDVVGGLAGTFQFDDGVRLERFYHHWFNNDAYVPSLVKELGMEGDVITLPTRTGVYYNGRMWTLSTPMDLLRFSPLSFLDRIRLGLLVLRVRMVRDWHAIENKSIREWLEPLCGRNVYRVVWEPLIQAKFSIFAEKINAVWMWKKLVLRGGTRNDKGGEELCYFKGGFGRLAEALAGATKKYGGEIRLGERVERVVVNGDKVVSVVTNTGEMEAGEFLFTPAFPIIQKLFEKSSKPEWLDRLGRVNYLGNMCLVLRLKRSLSETYWINVNDPGFPFVGVIEHTNFDSISNYNDSHIAYLSRYLPVSDHVWAYSDEEYLEFALQHLKRMFPEVDRSWVIEYRVWRSEYAQPVTERDYSKYVPTTETPFDNAIISTMAQIYPEDRGTNYAIREGRLAARTIIGKLV